MLLNMQLSLQIIILFLIAFLWLVIITVWFYMTEGHYRKLVEKTGETDLKKILEKILALQSQNQEEIRKVGEKIEELEREGFSHVQKIGVVRFNPFPDTGGDHSFVVTLLDGNLDGVVITSLHTRENTRTYVKPIEKGKSKFELSKEERQALERAKQ